MPGKRGRPRKRSLDHKLESSHSDFNLSSDYYEDHHLLQQQSTTQSVCFICNQNYVTTVASAAQYDISKVKLLTFCERFKLDQTSEKEELYTLAGFTDPFCQQCWEKTNHLHAWMVQLRLLLKNIQQVKEEFNRLMITSYPVSVHIGGTHYLKTKLVQSATHETSYYGATYTTINTAELEHELFNSLLHQVPEAVKSVEVVSSAGDELEEHGFDASQVEIDEEDEEYFPPESPKIKKTTKSFKSGNKSPRSKRSSGGKTRTRTPYNGEKIYADPSGQCHLCPSNFPTQFALTRHMKRKHSGITYQCRYCDKSFHDTSNRKRHEFAAHIVKTRDFVCELCGKAYFTKELLREHNQTKHLGIRRKSHMPNPTQCPHCGRILSKQKNYALHVRLYHTEGRKQHECEICGKPFVTRESLKRHRHSHMSLAEQAALVGKTYFYKCPICPLEGQIGYKSRPALLTHYTLDHPDTVPPPYKKIPAKPRGGKKSKYKFPCEECTKRPLFTSAEALQAHIIGGHVEKKRVKIMGNCAVCEKPCKDKWEAKQHVKTHQPKCYKCAHCDDRHLRVKEMREHYEEHHPGVEPPVSSLNIYAVKEKLFFCPECPDNPGYTQRKRLNEHIRKGHIKRKSGRPKSTEPRARPKRIRPSRSKKRIIVRKIVRSSSESGEETESENDVKTESESEKEVKKEFESEEETEYKHTPTFSRSGRFISMPARFEDSKKVVTVKKVITVGKIGSKKKVVVIKNNHQNMQEVKVPLQRLDIGPLRTVKIEVVDQY